MAGGLVLHRTPVVLHGETRSDDTHESTTDPDALAARKGNGKEAKLSYRWRTGTA